MRGVRATRHGVDHHLGVAVIGGDQHRSAFGAHSFFNLAQARVHRLNRFDGGLDLARVPDHVGVGEVDDDHVKCPVIRGFHHRFRDAGGAHLRFEIVSRNLRRLDHHPIFAGKWLFDSAIEKIRDVRVLLRLRHAQVAHLLRAHHVRQNVGHRLGRNHNRQAEVFVVLRHADIFQILRHAIARNRRIKFRRSRQIAAALFIEPTVAAQRAGNLAHAVGAKVKANARIVVANLRQRLAVRIFICTYKGQHKFVRHAFVV